jgi:peroxiredoxin
MRAAALAAIAVAAGCGGPRAPAPVPARAVSLSLPALDGGTISLQSYRGRPVVLHFFTSWDGGAQHDVAQLIELYRSRGDEIEIIGIALDPAGRTMVAPWRDALGVPYLVGLVTDDLRAGRTALGRITAVPTTILLDERGAEVARVVRELAPGELAQLLNRAP